ncbi:MutShomolog 4-like protein [Cladobotryum mycophilum]|uniref:MutShomolog 4-like protein n=1 Tax=Cladobotryum mycophilum TaxID=491253 RepID=A0ABR0S8H1_9HYPO
MSFASPAPPSPGSSTSSYFRSSAVPQSSVVTHSPESDGFGIDSPDSDPRRRIEYAPSVSTSRPSTSRTDSKTTATRLSIALAHTIICAISESRGVSPLVGLAFINVILGEVILSQIFDTQSYIKAVHRIQMVAPSHILFTAAACPPNVPGTLYLLLRHLLPEAQIESVDRSAWSASAGLDYLQNLAFQSDVEPIKIAIHGKYYSICSLAAAMTYIEHHFTMSFSPHSLRIKYQPSDDTMMIDIATIQSLEIMQNLKNPKSKESLLGLLNHTLTHMGFRMLRSNLLQPPTVYESFIEHRYQAVQELVSNEEIFRETRKALKSFDDVEKLSSSSVKNMPESEEEITQVLMVKSFLESVSELYRALLPAQSHLLVKCFELCDPKWTVPILNNIKIVIEPNVRYMKSALDLRNQRAFAVRSGIDAMLDVSRQTYKELTEEIHIHVDRLNGKEHKLAASLKFDNGRKYWLRVRMTDLDGGPLPESLINIVRKKDIIQCQTLDLVKLNRRITDISNEIARRSRVIIQDLIKELRKEAPHLFKVCESIALVDMLASFGQLASIRDYVCPEIGDTLAMNKGRHPVLDNTLSGDYVPNDYYATPEQYRFHIVTGCNMSGKSTYIRAVALLQIMAQVGSFVPAEFASFSIIHNIFARISTDDSIEESLSTFSLEMREMNFILKNVNGKSIAIIDELGRGTSTRDGLAIALAMSEALIDSHASVWFATHFVELARVLGERSGVINLHLKSDTTTDSNGMPRLTMRYRATDGTVDTSQHYGINLARAMGLPASFIQKAEEVAKDLRQKREANQRNSESRKVLARRKIVLTLYEALKQANNSDSEDALPRHLEQLQVEFIRRMEEVESGNM